jgi:hypothetical protein
MKKLNNLLIFSFVFCISLMLTKPASATVCGTDTVRFTMEKATGYGTLAINNLSSATALAQFYTAPQAITIYGFDFYGRSETLPTMTLMAYVYRAGADSLPTGAPLATASIVVDSSTDTNLNQVVFSTPLTVTFPYLLVVSNPSPDNFAIFSNDWLVGDGAFDNLSSALIGSVWYAAAGLSVGGAPYNADAIFNPYVSYTIVANDSITPVPYCSGSMARVTDRSSAILHDPMYSVAAFYNVDSLQFTYDITGFPTIYDDNFSFTVPAVGTYSVVQTDTMFAWTDICVASITKSMTVITTPATPSSITGPPTMCSGGVATYHTTPVPYATSYVWTLPSGWTGTSTYDSITVIAGSSSGNITVYARNGCGNSGTATLALVSTGTIAIPGVITGVTNPCAGTTEMYYVAPVFGASSYAWTLPAGWTGTSTTDTIYATAGTASGNIGVSAVSIACGRSAPSTLLLTPRNVPNVSAATIFVPTPVCAGTSYLMIALGVSGAVNYTWSLPSDWTGSSTNDSMLATAGMMSGYVVLSATNLCGVSLLDSTAVSSISVPPAPGAISGDNTPCFNGAADYSIAAVSTATSYTWTLPLGWSGSSSTVLMQATNNSSSGTMSVVANNVCGSSSASTLAVTPAASGITATASPINASSSTAGDGSISLSGTTGGTAPYQYAIDSVTFQSNPYYGTLLPGTYTITIRDTNGCMSSLSVDVSFNSGIRNTDLLQVIHIFPNPASSFITLDAKFSHLLGKLELSIFDLIGNKLITHEYSNLNLVNRSIDVSSLSAGQYILKMTMDNEVYNERFTIIR